MIAINKYQTCILFIPWENFLSLANILVLYQMHEILLWVAKALFLASSQDTWLQSFLHSVNIVSSSKKLKLTSTLSMAWHLRGLGKSVPACLSPLWPAAWFSHDSLIPKFHYSVYSCWITVFIYFKEKNLIDPKLEAEVCTQVKISKQVTLHFKTKHLLL